MLVPALVEDNEGESRNIYLFYRARPQSREYSRLFRYETHVHVLHEASEKKRRVFFHSTHTRTTTCTKTGSGIYVFPRADSDVPSRQLGDARTLCPQNDVVDPTPSKFSLVSCHICRGLVLNNISF